MLGKIHLIGIVYVFCYVTPLITISVFYAMIARKVWFRPAFERSNENSRKIIQRSKSKVLKMLCLVVVLFAISWLPLLTLYVYVTMNTDGKIAEKISKAMPFLQFIGQANSCINPIIYCLYSTKFRKGFKQLVCFRMPLETQITLSTRKSALSTGRKSHSPMKDECIRKTFKSSSSCKPSNATHAMLECHQPRKQPFRALCCVSRMRNSCSSFPRINELHQTDRLNNRKANYGNKFNEMEEKNSQKNIYGAGKINFEMHEL